MKLKCQKLRLSANSRQTEIDRTVGANQKTFTRSHEAAYIHTDTVTHSSRLNMSYFGFRQVQQTVHFTSSIKITLTMTTDIKNQLFTKEEFPFRKALPSAQGLRQHPQLSLLHHPNRVPRPSKAEKMK